MIISMKMNFRQTTIIGTLKFLVIKSHQFWSRRKTHINFTFPSTVEFKNAMNYYQHKNKNFCPWLSEVKCLNASHEICEKIKEIVFFVKFVSKLTSDNQSEPLNNCISSFSNHQEICYVMTRRDLLTNACIEMLWYLLLFRVIFAKKLIPKTSIQNSNIHFAYLQAVIERDESINTYFIISFDETIFINRWQMFC